VNIYIHVAKYTNLKNFPVLQCRSQILHFIHPQMQTNCYPGVNGTVACSMFTGIGRMQGQASWIWPGKN